MRTDFHALHASLVENVQSSLSYSTTREQELDAKFASLDKKLGFVDDVHARLDTMNTKLAAFDTKMGKLMEAIIH